MRNGHAITNAGRSERFAFQYFARYSIRIKFQRRCCATRKLLQQTRLILGRKVSQNIGRR
jgi:hypothetical protein